VHALVHVVIAGKLAENESNAVDADGLRPSDSWLMVHEARRPRRSGRARRMARQTVRSLTMISKDGR
jgi:hypothetical protein